LSARLPAEGLSILAIVAAVRGVRWLAIVLLAVAFVTHPLMTLPAVITLGVLLLLKHDSWTTVLSVSLALSVACLVAGAILGGSSPLMTGDWLAAVRSRSNYLFVDNWTVDDWQNVGLVLLTATFATRFPVGDWARRISVAAVCTAVAGLLATAFVSLVLPLRVVIQGQPWRWIWIATLLAIALLPRTLRLMWAQSDAGKAAALFLSIAWLMNGVGAEGSQLTGLRLPFAAGAVGLIAFQHRLPGRTASLLLRGAWLVAVLCLLWVASIFATEAGLDFDFGGDPAWIQRIGGALLSPAVAVLVVAGGVVVGFASTEPRRRDVVAALGAALALGAAPQAWAQWSSQRFGDEQRREFAGWRDRIGPDQEVLWPDGLQRPGSSSSAAAIYRFHSWVGSCSPKRWRRKRADELTPSARSFPRKAGSMGAATPPTCLTATTPPSSPRFAVPQELRSSSAGLISTPTPCVPNGPRRACMCTFTTAANGTGPRLEPPRSRNIDVFHRCRSGLCGRRARSVDAGRILSGTLPGGGGHWVHCRHRRSVRIRGALRILVPPRDGRSSRVRSIRSCRPDGNRAQPCDHLRGGGGNSLALPGGQS
jgi:hypothetical protein